MYTLYHHPYSQNARRVVALLETAGLEYELRHVALDKGEHLSQEFLAINPNHQIPVLIDDKVKLFESNAILRYLCTKHGLTDWYPDALATRAMVDQWLDWNQCRLAPTVTDIVLNKVFMGEAGDKSAITRGEEKLIELAAILNAGLEGHDFIAGTQPTIADLSIGSNISQLGFADAIPKEPNITNWYRRVCALEGFKKSLPQA